MRTITAVINPSKLEEVRDSLKVLGISGMTVSEVSGFGRQRGHSEVYRGAEYTISFIPKIRIDIITEDQEVDTLLKAISAVAQTGSVGDGKIWVTPVEQVVRIRTGERGDDAL